MKLKIKKLSIKKKHDSIHQTRNTSYEIELTKFKTNHSKL